MNDNDDIVNVLLEDISSFDKDKYYIHPLNSAHGIRFDKELSDKNINKFSDYQ